MDAAEMQTPKPPFPLGRVPLLSNLLSSFTYINAAVSSAPSRSRGRVRSVEALADTGSRAEQSKGARATERRIARPQLATREELGGVVPGLGTTRHSWARLTEDETVRIPPIIGYETRCVLT